MSEQGCQTQQRPQQSKLHPKSNRQAQAAKHACATILRVKQTRFARQLPKSVKNQARTRL
jgi:hypothetical protein